MFFQFSSLLDILPSQFFFFSLPERSILLQADEQPDIIFLFRFRLIDFQQDSGERERRTWQSENLQIMKFSPGSEKFSMGKFTARLFNVKRRNTIRARRKLHLIGL